MAQLVQAPSRKPRAGGIKDIVGSYVEEGRLGGPAGIAWEDATCGFPSPTQAGCYDTVTPAADKEFEGYGQYTSIDDPFALYAGIECWIGGDSEGDTYPVLARTKLEWGEDRALEAALVAWASASTGTVAAADLVAAIGAADEYADANYVGLPVLLLSRAQADAAFAAGALEFINGQLVTANKTPVLSTSAAAGADGISIIGYPAVYASSILSRETVSPSDNLGRGLAERVYAIGVDCDFRYTVTITP